MARARLQSLLKGLEARKAAAQRRFDQASASRAKIVEQIAFHEGRLRQPSPVDPSRNAFLFAAVQQAQLRLQRRLEEEIQQLRELLHRFDEQTYAPAQRELAVASRKVSSIERINQHRKDAATQAQQASEQRILDDVAARRWRLGRPDSHQD